MKTLVIPFLVGVAAISSGRASAQSYELEVFTPSSAPGVDFGFYSALSNRARLVSGFDSTGDPVGVIQSGHQPKVFRVGLAQEEYCWYAGVNNRCTTVGYKDVQGTPDTAGWIRTRTGDVRTFGTAGERNFLYRVNDQDVAVGETTIAGGAAWRAFRVDDLGGTVVTVPGVDPALNTYFAAINNEGSILGGSWNAAEHHQFILHGNTVTYFGIDGAHEIGLRALDNHGQAAGFWTEYEPLIGDYISHGFIRKPNGHIRNVDVDYDFPQHEVYDPEWYGGYPILEVTGDLLVQGTKILDLNDRGQILTEMTGWYLITLYIDGVGEVEFVEPRWTYPIGTPTH